MDAHEDQQFLEMVAKSLVDHPDDITINRAVDDMGVLLTLDVHADDMGKIIGRSGNTVNAIRTLLRVVGMKHEARVNLKINEPEAGSPSLTTDDAVAMSNEPEAGADLTTDADQALDDLKI